MAQVQELASIADADAMLAASHDAPVYLLKHSIACPISARGQMEFVGLEGPDDPALYAVVVQYARDVSAYIAETLGVKHETPQAILIHNGEAVDVKSHGAIRIDALREAAAALVA
jgi:bacillithiol system protein YtxJ